MNLVKDYLIAQKVEVQKIDPVQESYFNQMTYRGCLERCDVQTAENFKNTSDYQKRNYLSFDLAAEI